MYCSKALCGHVLEIKTLGILKAISISFNVWEKLAQLYKLTVPNIYFAYNYLVLLQLKITMFDWNQILRAPKQYFIVFNTKYISDTVLETDLS